MTGTDIEHGIVKWFDDQVILARYNDYRKGMPYRLTPVQLIKDFRWGLCNDGTIKCQIVEAEDELFGPDWDCLSDTGGLVLDSLTVKDLARVVKEFEKLVPLL